MQGGYNVRSCSNSGARFIHALQMYIIECKHSASFYFHLLSPVFFLSMLLENFHSSLFWVLHDKWGCDTNNNKQNRCALSKLDTQTRTHRIHLKHSMAASTIYQRRYYVFSKIISKNGKKVSITKGRQRMKLFNMISMLQKRQTWESGMRACEYETIKGGRGRKMVYNKLKSTLMCAKRPPNRQYKTFEIKRAKHTNDNQQNVKHIFSVCVQK